MVVQRLLEAGIRPTVIICETALYSRNLTNASKDKSLQDSICNLGYDIYADTFINTIFVACSAWRSPQVRAFAQAREPDERFR